MRRKMRLLGIMMAAIFILATLTALSQFSTATAKIRVACVGDSITRGSGYPAKLQALLGPKYEVQNFGADGATVSLNSSSPYMNVTAFKKALSFNPDIVVIMLGTNDADPRVIQYNNTFEDDYARLVSSFQSLNSDPQVWIAESPPIQNTSLTLSSQDFSQTIIPHIENVAQNLNLPTINVYDSFQNYPTSYLDGVHPDTDGATLIACDVAMALTPDGQVPGI